MSDLERLRELPVRSAVESVDLAARAAFVSAFQSRSLFGRLARGIVPAALAGIVGVYLSWAFSLAIALNN